MLIQGQVGPIASSTSLSAGVQSTVRMDNLGGLAASQLLPRYYESTYRRTMYTVANQTPATLAAVLSGSYTGLLIANPTTSSVNVVINKVAYAITVPAATAAATLSLMTGVGASITGNITPRNRFVGGVGSQCLASTGAISLPGTAVVETILDGATTTAFTSIGPKVTAGVVDLEGSLILPPGAFCAFYTTTAFTLSTTTGFSGSFQWVEVPL
tara:strand:+ start:1040 stop:1678 length:639 start_codon:yes stop_codon:yes gene_type:complete